MIKLEELVAMNEKEFQEKKAELIKEAQELLENNDLEGAQAIKDLLDEATKARKEKTVTEPAKEVAPVEQMRADLKELENRSLFQRALVTSDITSNEVPIQDVIGDLTAKDTFKITNHVNTLIQSNGAGTLPSTTISETLTSVDELQASPELVKGKMPLEADKFETTAFRKWLAFSNEMLEDAFGNTATDYVSSIAEQVIENTKLQEVIKKAEETSAPVAFDKDAFLTGLGNLPQGNAQLFANKKNILKVLGGVEHTPVIENGKVFAIILGVKVEVIELPERYANVLLMNRDGIKIVQNKRTADSFKVIDKTSTTGQLNVNSFYAKALVITSRFDTVANEKVATFTVA